MHPASCQYVTIDVSIMCFPPLQPCICVMSSKILNLPPQKIKITCISSHLRMESLDLRPKKCVKDK